MSATEACAKLWYDCVIIFHQFVFWTTVKTKLCMMIWRDHATTLNGLPSWFLHFERLFHKLLPDVIKPILEPTVTNHQWNFVAFTWQQFYRKRYRNQFINLSLKITFFKIKATSLREEWVKLHIDGLSENLVCYTTTSIWSKSFMFQLTKSPDSFGKEICLAKLFTTRFHGTCRCENMCGGYSVWTALCFDVLGSMDRQVVQYIGNTRRDQCAKRNRFSHTANVFKSTVVRYWPVYFPHKSLEMLSSYIFLCC